MTTMNGRWNSQTTSINWYNSKNKINSWKNKITIWQMKKSKPNKITKSCAKNMKKCYTKAEKGTPRARKPTKMSTPIHNFCWQSSSSKLSWTTAVLTLKFYQIALISASNSNLFLNFSAWFWPKSSNNWELSISVNPDLFIVIPSPKSVNFNIKMDYE